MDPACREAASWPNQLQISVNLSPVQFRNDDIVRLVHETLIETGLDAGRLELPVTAEGVETRAQLGVLTRAGSDLVPGLPDRKAGVDRWLCGGRGPAGQPEAARSAGEPGVNGAGREMNIVKANWKSQRGDGTMRLRLILTATALCVQAMRRWLRN